LEEPSARWVKSAYGNLGGDRLADHLGCHLTLVFDEPLEPSEGPFDGLADWYRHSDSREARAARRDLNAWYAAFPDREGMLLGNLQGDSDIGIEQATDELYVHHLLFRSHQVRYEEDANSPDFRLYRSSEYVAGIEVLTLFPEKDFVSATAHVKPCEQSRCERLSVQAVRRRSGTAAGLGRPARPPARAQGSAAALAAGRALGGRERR
jgi:hypothetical protein